MPAVVAHHPESVAFNASADRGAALATQASDPRGVFPTYGLYQTADGWMFVGALTESFWTALAMLLERTDLLADPDLPQNPLAMGRPDVRERLRRELEPIFRSQTTSEWLRVSDMVGAAEVTLAVIELAADA